MPFPACLLSKQSLESHFARHMTVNLFPLCSLCKALIMPSSTWASKGQMRRSSLWPRRRWSFHSLLEMLLPCRRETSPRMEAPSRRPSPLNPERGRHGANASFSVAAREIIDGERRRSLQVNSSVLFKHSPVCSFWIFEKETKGDEWNHNIPAFHEPPFVRFHIANQPHSRDLACSTINMALMSNVVLNLP